MKQESPIDKLSFSIMDVLTNALIGITVLLLIEALTIGANTKNVEARKPGLGDSYVVSKFSPLPPDTKRPLNVIQLQLIGGKPTNVLLEFEGEATVKDSIKLVQDLMNPADWIIMKKGKYSGEWKIKMISELTGNLPDSIKIIANSSFLLTCAGKFPIYKYPGSKIIKPISVQEMIDKPPIIRIDGKVCI